MFLFYVVEQEKWLFRFEEPVFLPTRTVNCCKQEYQFKRLRLVSLFTMA